MKVETKIKIAFAGIAVIAVYLVWSNYNNAKQILALAVSEDKKQIAVSEETTTEEIL